MAISVQSLSAVEQRQDAAQECYRFAGATETWRYTSAETDVLADLDGGMQTYASAAIARGGLSYGPEAGRRAIEFVLPADLPLAARFVGLAALESMTVTVWRRYASEDAWRLLWTGRVLQARHGGGRLALRCEPASVGLKRVALRRLYTRTCPHVLYGPECKAAPQSLSAIVTNVWSASDFSISVSTSADLGGGWLVAPGGAAHMIERDNGYGGALRTLYPSGLAVGDAITLYKGCDHSLQTCGSRFANALNFGGYPWLPRKNPFADNVF